LRGIQQHWSEFEAHGIRVAAISVDPAETTRNFTRKKGYLFTFLSDPNAEVIRRYDLLHPKAGPDEKDVARPAEFLLDPSGTVRWVNLTENYWVRATPEQMLQAANTVR
jgi:peroxiredoxin